jgi:TatD DNase family protein
MQRLIDTHCHLTDERLIGEAEEVVARARAAGVTRMVTVGTSPEGGRAAVALAGSVPGVWAAVGIHPHAASGASPEALSEIESLAGEPRVVAVGETGLDYFYDNSPRPAQRDSFLRHLDMGRRLGLPVIVHTRDADEDTAAVLREAGGGVRGVLHCFTGGRMLMDTALELGWYVSFAGMITFPRWADAALLRAVPDDRILVETDSPYLAPVPFRGKRNEPAYVAHVAARAAELRAADPAEFAATVVRNAERFYGLEPEGGA